MRLPHAALAFWLRATVLHTVEGEFDPLGQHQTLRAGGMAYLTCLISTLTEFNSQAPQPNTPAAPSFGLGKHRSRLGPCRCGLTVEQLFCNQ
jgi:hypothetical protein